MGKNIRTVPMTVSDRDSNRLNEACPSKTEAHTHLVNSMYHVRTTQTRQSETLKCPRHANHPIAQQGSVDFPQKFHFSDGCILLMVSVEKVPKRNPQTTHKQVELHQPTFWACNKSCLSWNGSVPKREMARKPEPNNSEGVHHRFNSLNGKTLPGLKMALSEGKSQDKDMRDPNS